MKKLLLVFSILGILSFLQAEDIISYDGKLKANGKNVLLILGSKSCHYCDILKKDINDNKKLNNLIKGKMNVYYVPIDEQVSVEMGDKNPPVKTTSLSLKMQFGSRNTPTIIIFDENWKDVIKLPGYIGPEFMQTFVQYVNDDIYKSKELNQFLQEKGMI